MKTLITACVIALLVQASPLAAESIRVEHGHLSIVVERGEKPYWIVSASFRTATEAAGFLDYLDKNWPAKSRPTIVVEYRYKLAPRGDEIFAAALVRIGRGTRWKIIQIPSPRGAIPDSSMILRENEKKWSRRKSKPEAPRP